MPPGPKCSGIRVKRQPACKPGSVWPLTKANDVTAIHLERLSPGASRDRPGRLAWIKPGQSPRRPFLVLLPVGFAVPSPLPGPRWALTPPFHPCSPSPLGLVCAERPFRGLPAIGRRAVYFLWHFPWGHPRRMLSGTVYPWSPDFPPRFREAAVQPAGKQEVASGGREVKSVMPRVPGARQRRARRTARTR